MAEYKDITELKKQISDFKKTISSPNSDYMNGYISALSVTEGMIAGLPTISVAEMESRWISVEKRLPEEDTRVLVYLVSERSYTEIDTDRMTCGKWVRWGSDVTHWMPLPEPPKGE